MSATQVTRVRNGETVTVRTGVLRGAGPTGAMGPPGPRGLQGDPGPVGPPGSINDLRSTISSTATVATSDDHWYPIPFTTLSTNDVLVDTVANPYDPYQFAFTEAGAYLILARVHFAEHGSGVASTGARRVRLVDQADTVYAEVDQDAVPFGDTVVTLATILDPRVDYTYRFQVESSDGIGISCTSRQVDFLRIGSGPAGVIGPPGPVGDEGPVGPTGPAGDASTGFASYNAVWGAGHDSSAAPTATVATADQGLPIPGPTQAPATPGFLMQLAQALETRLISRYASTAEHSAKRPTDPHGSVFYTEDSGAFYVHEKNDTNSWLGRVTISTSTPPAGTGQAARGLIWLQVE